MMYVVCVGTQDDILRDFKNENEKKDKKGGNSVSFTITFL